MPVNGVRQAPFFLPGYQVPRNAAMRSASPRCVLPNAGSGWGSDRSIVTMALRS